MEFLERHIVEFAIIGIVIGVQVFVFFKSYNKIQLLQDFFPLKGIGVITENDQGKNQKISSEGEISPGFKEVLNSINTYLRKNKGSAANFEIIKDITERHITVISNSIASTISAPLYLGLVGTFFGIIYGLGIIVFSSSEGTDQLITEEAVTNLISGVLVAMIASAAGLVFTLLNSVFFFKEALNINDRAKNSFYDFVQAELLPQLSKDVSDSLGTLRSNLDHFNNKFGENLVNYQSSFSLLNDNLVRQKDFLEAVQEVGLQKLSKQIVNTFQDVNEASNHFHDFTKYQDGLNKNISSSIAILKQYNELTSSFAEFNNNLSVVSESIHESSDFYQQFKSFLENHFGEVEHRKNVFTNSIDKIDAVLTGKLEEISAKTLKHQDVFDDQWRAVADNLNEDLSGLFKKMHLFLETEAKSLKSYLSGEEEGIKKILEENKQFFKDFRFVEQLFQKVSAHAETTHIHYQNVEKGLDEILNSLNLDRIAADLGKSLSEIKILLEEIKLNTEKSDNAKEK